MYDVADLPPVGLRRLSSDYGRPSTRYGASNVAIQLQGQFDHYTPVKTRDGVFKDCPRPRRHPDDKNLWPWPWPHWPQRCCRRTHPWMVKTQFDARPRSNICIAVTFTEYVDINSQRLIARTRYIQLTWQDFQLAIERRAVPPRETKFFLWSCYKTHLLVCMYAQHCLLFSERRWECHDVLQMCQPCDVLQSISVRQRLPPSTASITSPFSSTYDSVPVYCNSKTRFSFALLSK